MTAQLHGHARRLFTHYEDVENLPATSPDLVIAKLMEEGDGEDLRWLCRQFPEMRLASWLDRHDTRLLSRRSRCFWRVLLDRNDQPTQCTGDSLWPL